MPKYRYEGVGAEGEPVIGSIEAPTPREAAEALHADGTDVARLVPDGPPPLKKRVPLRDVTLLCEQLASLLQSEVPLPEALHALSHEAHRASLRDGLKRLAEGLERGESLDTLLTRAPEQYPPLLSAIIRAGLAGGNLPETLRLAATHFARVTTLRGQIISAVAYPLLVLVLALAVTLPVLHYVVPSFEVMFYDMNVDLPWLTQTLIAVSHWLPWVMISLVGLSVALWFAVERLDRIAPCVSLKRQVYFHVPLLGRALRAAYLSRFCGLMAVLLKTRLSLERAIDLSLAVDPSSIAPASAEAIRSSLQRGATLADALRSEKRIFPELLLWMVANCEQTHRLPETFHEASDLYAAEVDRNAHLLHVLIPPVMYLFVGGLLVAVVLSLFLPLIGTIEGLIL